MTEPVETHYPTPHFPINQLMVPRLIALGWTPPTTGEPMPEPVRADFFANAITLDEVVGQAVGAGSVCWENMSGTGVFQDQRAVQIVDLAVERIRQLVESARAEEIAELRRQRDRAEQIAEDRANLLNALDGSPDE